MKLNYGSGETKLDGFINIDIELSAKPDLVCDLRKEPFPYETSSIDEIRCIHNLEHIEQKYWNQVFAEFYRVLKPEGCLYLAYPEFEICAKFFIEDFKGMRDFWQKTLYGRQLYPGDYHVVPMRTSQVIDYLKNHGFHKISSTPEPFEEYNTFVEAFKGELPLTREQIFRREVFAI